MNVRMMNWTQTSKTLSVYQINGHFCLLKSGDSLKGVLTACLFLKKPMYLFWVLILILKYRSPGKELQRKVE